MATTTLVSDDHNYDNDIIEPDDYSVMKLNDKTSIDNKNGDFQDHQKNVQPDTFQYNEIVWRNVIILSILHVLAFIAWIIFIINPYVKWQTAVATFLFGLFSSSLGITAGAHRLWSHRSYKAKWPLRLVLAFANTMALQNDIYEWCRDHRVHHKYSETNADPHDSRRGFFFAHMGWLMLKKHKDVKEKGKNIDLTDLWNDPIVRFQRRFYIPLVLIIWGLIPTLIPYYFWNESLLFSFLGCVCFRYIYVLHCTWLVNSAAHLWGHRPYDKNIGPRENNSVVYLAFGEGYHNYHHVFPWDYSASEYGFGYNFNLTTFLIDLFERCGLAYDLKKPSRKTIDAKKLRSGDGTENLIIRRKYIFDWIVGMLITMSQLIVSFILRFIYLQFVPLSS